MTGYCCKGCRFNFRSQCRKFPPKVVSVTGSTKFPRVKDDWCCGQFEGRAWSGPNIGERNYNLSGEDEEKK